MAGRRGRWTARAVIGSIRLEGLGVIAEATLPLAPGFTAITGETGAGKTMVLTGLGLLLGRRADPGAVRSGVPAAVAEGTWTVPADGAIVDRVREAGGDVEPAGDGAAELILTRTISAEGRSRASVGGRSAPASVLADLAEQLVAVHGQSDQMRLRSAGAQRDVLDRYGGDDLSRAAVRHREAFARAARVRREREELTRSRQERSAAAAALRADLAEIGAVAPEPGEDDALADRERRLAGAEALRAAAAAAHAALSADGENIDAITLLADARRALEREAGTDPAVADLAERAAGIGFQAADLAADLAGYLADLDEDSPALLAAVQERRAALAGLSRRHGSYQAVLDLAANGPERLADLEDDGRRAERLEAEAAAADAEEEAAAAELTALRTAAAARLSDAVTAELSALALPDARLTVAVAPAPATAAGRDEVTILLAPHPGAEPRPVARSASGGELSRVMLALEVVLAAVDPVPTFVFDEVDAGIGGAAAIEVGRRLGRLARSSQVIVVTHLAQVAAFAENHLAVRKQSDGSVTASSVTALTGPDRERELARMLSGLAESPAAVDHARELLRMARRDR